MGSRLRMNPSHFMECWCEIVSPQGSDHPPWIIQKFPRTYNEEEVLKSIPQFTFPCPFEKTAVQHFSFVLTNVESKFLYGFCRHAPDTDTALVVLSHLPWHELFYKMLNHCSTLIQNKNSGDLWSFLQSFYLAAVPAPGTQLTLSYDDNKFFVSECPNHFALPSIPENRNLSEYFSAVDVSNMMIVFASMLNERRIVVTSDRVARLSACVQAANTLLYPMTWQHIFIPVLPEHLIDYLSAPMPFLIGVPWSLMQKVRLEELGDAVILNADTNRVSTPFTDLQDLPEEVVSSLRKSLSPPNQLLGDGVARAFMRALVHLIGNYREAIQFREEDKRITFNEEKFVAQRPPHFQPFVEKMLELQIFRQFVEERLELLSSGLHTSDEFELEASVYGDRSSSKMKQIFSNVKMGSGAIMKNVKSKTNPAMRSAVKSVTKGGRNVREKSRVTYKELRGKLKDIQQKSTDSSFSTYVNGVKPRSAPSSPTLPPKRTYKAISGVYEGGYSVRTTYKRVSQPSSRQNVNATTYSSSTKSLKQSTSPTSSGDSEKTPPPQEMDLIGEMENVLKTQLVFSTTSSLQETTSTVSIDSSVVSSEPGGGSLFPVEFPSEPAQEKRTMTNGEDRLAAPVDSKPLSASLVSLPLLDLSLDIPLPPPLFDPPPAISSSSLPPPPYTIDGRPPSSFRSPKILPPETFGSLPSSLEGTTVSVPLPHSSLGNGPTTQAVSPASRPKAHTLPCEGERQVGVGAHPPVPVPRKRPPPQHFPKYDVSPSFSASLAKFSFKGDSGSYYYSSLSKTSSRSSDSILDFETPIRDSFGPPSPPSSRGKPPPSPPLSPPDILAEPAAFCDVMTMSLPPGITSLSELPAPPASSSSRSCSAYSSSPQPPPPPPSPPPLPVLSPPPRSRRRRKKATSPAQENGASQDLLLLESPKDEEEFDPLFTKDIPPPVPSRQQKRSVTGNRETSLPPKNKVLPIEPPGKLNPDRYLPFGSLQTVVPPRRIQPPPRGIQNPVYDLHQPPFMTGGRNSFDPFNPQPPSADNNNINNNPAATFAASLLSTDDGLGKHRSRSPLPPAAFQGNSVISGMQGQASLTERELLGDFCSDFKKLSVAGPQKVAADRGSGKMVPPPPSSPSPAFGT